MNKLQEEVCVLVSSALGGHQGQVDGRVVEVVGDVESEAGLRKLGKVISQSGRTKPWYKRWWMLGLCCALLLTGIWLVQTITFDAKAVSPIPQKNKLFGLFGGMSLFGSRSDFTEEEKWILNGDVVHPLHETIPYDFGQSDSALKQYAAEYVSQYEGSNGVFPPDLIEIGSAVDPDNPWYLYLKVSDIADVTVSAKSKKERERENESKREKARRIADAGGKDEPAFIVDDAYYQKLSEAYELIEKADAMGELKQHRVDLLKRRLNILSSAGEHDYFSRIGFLNEAFGFTYNSIEYLKLSAVFDAKFQQLKERGDKEEVEKWLGIYKRYLDSMINSSSSMVDLLVVQAHWKNHLTEIQAVAEAVGLNEEAKKMKRLSDQLAEDKVARTNSYHESGQIDPNQYGILSGLLVGTNRMSIKPLEFDPDEHLSDRYTDHSFITKYIALLGTVLLFVVLMFVASYLLYKGKLARFFGDRILSLLTVKDWVLIILGGVILPIIFYYVVNQHTPLGVRKWNVLAGESSSIMLQFINMLLLMITASYCLLRWKLSVRSCGAVKKNDWRAWSALVSSFVALLLIGFNGYEISWTSYITAFLALYVICFFLVRGARAYISNERLISVAAMNRGMITLLILAIISTAMLVPFYYADEKKWIREDTLMTLSPEHLGDTSRGYRTMMAIKEELQERLEMIR